MSISVRDLMNFSVFHSAKIITGKEGLGNKVTRVNFMGVTTREVNEMTDVDIHDLVNDGDFYISGNVFFKRKTVDYYDEFHNLIKQSSSGICIVGYTPGDIDDRILKLCDSHNYPIISLASKTPFSSLVDVIMNAIIRDRLDKRVDFILHKIMNTNCDTKQILDYLEEINPNLYDNFMTLYISTQKEDVTNFIRDRFELNNNSSLIYKYGNGTLLMITSRSNNKNFFIKEIENFKYLIRNHFVEVHIGISDLFNSLKNFKTSVNEAILSNKLAVSRNYFALMHNDLEMEGWLNKMKTDKDMLKYMNQTLKPIYEYEKEHPMDLIKTIEIFVKCEGNYKKMAAELFIHDNTVRYRMEKIKEILNINNSKVSLYSRLNIAVKLSEIIGLDM